MPRLTRVNFSLTMLLLVAIAVNVLSIWHQFRSYKEAMDLQAKMVAATERLKHAQDRVDDELAELDGAVCFKDGKKLPGI